MNQISIRHPELGPQETLLSSDLAAGDLNSTVENTKSFAVNDLVVYGFLGEELTEIVTITSVTPNVTLGHTTGPIFAHLARTQVSQIRFNQAKVYRSDSETGDYTLIATVDLTVDDEDTTYEDSSGTSDNWYKIKYYNSITLDLSSFSVAVQGTGYTDDSLKTMTDEVLEEFGDVKGANISRSQVTNHLKSGVRKVIAQIMMSYPDYLKAYTTLTPNGTGLDPLPDGFLGLIRVDVNYSSTSSTESAKARYTKESKGYPNTIYSQSEPQVSIRGSNLVTRPTLTSTGGRIFMWYWAYPDPMDNDSDEHGLPFGARDVLINYALYKCWLPKDKDIASSYKSAYKDCMDECMNFLSQSPQAINNEMVEITQGAEDYE